jgi:Family of unknown function (DUF6191)
MTQWGLDTLFNPAKRHMDEEKRRLQSTREEVGDSSGGKRIDLESGKVVISRPAADSEGDAEPDGESHAEPLAEDEAEPHTKDEATADDSVLGESGTSAGRSASSVDQDSDERSA